MADPDVLGKKIMKIEKIISFFLIFIFLWALMIPTIVQGAAAGNSSPKKGAGSTWGWAEEVIRSVGVSWGYDWYVNAKAFNQNFYEHVPLIRSGDVPNNLAFIQDVARAHPGRYWLVFNEPDWYEQDNITPAAGADIYYQLRTAIKAADPSAKLIVGGVCIWPNPTWLTNFREEYKKKYGSYPVVEGWHVHIYVEPSNYNLNNWRSEIQFYKNWMIKNGETVELWLTEFGCLTSESTGLQIMQDQIPWLEAHPEVTRYAWFAFYIPADSPYKGSLLSATGQLTALGQLYATFGSSSSSFTINATAGNGGSIGPSGNVVVAAGASQTFTMTPNSGFRIADVNVDGVSAGAISSKTFTNVTSNHTIAASFVATSYSLSVAKNGTGTGNVGTNPAGSSFAPGTVVTLTATPDGGSTFAGWSGGCTGMSPTCQVTMNSNISVTATFNLKAATYTITATAGGNGSVSPSGAVTVNAGANKTFTITPNSGYRLGDVKVDGVSQGAISSYTFSNVTANHSLAATFAQAGSGPQVVFAVNCGGGQYTDKLGIVYKGDVNFSGGQVYTTTAAIAGTNDGPLYQSERWGNFSYNIPVPVGTYNVTLKFAELYCWGQNCRVFGVKVEGREVISNLDLFAKVGKNQAYDFTTPVTVTDGKLTVEFYSAGNNAKVNAILVTAGQ